MSVQLPPELQKYKKYIDMSKWDDNKIDPYIEDANAKTLQTYIAQRLAWDNRRLAIRLLEVTNKEEEHEWTQEEIEIQNRRGGGFSSAYVSTSTGSCSFSTVGQPQDMKKETNVPGRQVNKPLGSDQVLQTPQNQSRQTSAYKVPIPMISSQNPAAICDASGPLPDTFNFPAPPDGFERQLTDLRKQYTLKGRG
ncbi:unnamed protein product [Blumeria hordei]|uniref:Uncharacterized protein n=2 Tax=Blumeria hordei TaxID=2867405 RepID=A0A383UTT3_BLUHO|nr:putative powdery mildew-specific protein [Blumeria hordei DH14]SZF02740.1 unnamed protein product [Blumeria hordei]